MTMQPADLAPARATAFMAVWPAVPTVLPRVPPPGPVTLLMDAPALEAWVDARAGRLRRAGRPWQLLHLRAAPAAMPPGMPGERPDETTHALLLAACAHRLRAGVRGTDHVARVGDDGFAVLLDGATRAGARVAADRLLPLCEGPYRIGERRLALRVTLLAVPVLSLVPPG